MYIYQTESPVDAGRYLIKCGNGETWSTEVAFEVPAVNQTAPQFQAFVVSNLNPSDSASAAIVASIVKSLGAGPKVLIDMGAANDVDSVYYEKYYNLLQPLISAIPYQV